MVPIEAFSALCVVVLTFFVHSLWLKFKYDKLYDKWSLLVDEHTETKLDLEYNKQRYRVLLRDGYKIGQDDRDGKCEDIW